MSSMIFFHNTIQDWSIALGAAVSVFIIALLIKRIAYRKLSVLAAGTVTIWDDLLVELISRLNNIFFLAAAVYIGTLKLSLPEPVRKILHSAIVVILLVQMGLLCSQAVLFWVESFRRRKQESDGGAVTTLVSVGFVLHMVIWIVMILIGLDNFGVDITALIAGLGITGIAVALAIQNILGDLFASFSIVLDKPFVIGDFIVIDGYMGTVEHIGLKTTRIRSLSGEQLIFSNADLLKSRIRNFKRMQERRVVFFLRVAYHTPVERLREIPEMIRQAVENNPRVRFDRAHFAEYADFALKFEAVYWVTTPDYNEYMDIQQAINLELHHRLRQAGIEFANQNRIFVTAQDPGSMLTAES